MSRTMREMGPVEAYGSMFGGEVQTKPEVQALSVGVLGSVPELRPLGAQAVGVMAAELTGATGGSTGTRLAEWSTFINPAWRFGSEETAGQDMIAEFAHDFDPDLGEIQRTLAELMAAGENVWAATFLRQAFGEYDPDQPLLAQVGLMLDGKEIMAKKELQQQAREVGQLLFTTWQKFVKSLEDQYTEQQKNLAAENRRLDDIEDEMTSIAVEVGSEIAPSEAKAKDTVTRARRRLDERTEDTFTALSGLEKLVMPLITSLLGADELALRQVELEGVS